MMYFPPEAFFIGFYHKRKKRPCGVLNFDYLFGFFSRLGRMLYDKQRREYYKLGVAGFHLVHRMRMVANVNRERSVVGVTARGGYTVVSNRTS